jgi:signal transduction histidine kinase
LCAVHGTINQIQLKIFLFFSFSGFLFGFLFQTVNIVLACVSLVEFRFLESEMRVKNEVITKKFARSKKAKTLFLSTVSHELLTPLHALCATTELLKSNDAVVQIAGESLAVMSHCASVLSSLVRNILLHSQDQLPPAQYFFVDVRSFFREVAEMLRSLIAPQQKMRLNVAVDAEVPVRLMLPRCVQKLKSCLLL